MHRKLDKDSGASWAEARFSESSASENQISLKTLGCPQMTFSQAHSCAKSRVELRELEASFSTPRRTQTYSLESASCWSLVYK